MRSCHGGVDAAKHGFLCNVDMELVHVRANFDAHLIYQAFKFSASLLTERSVKLSPLSVGL